MLRRTILLGLGPAIAAAVCLLTAVQSPAADPPAQRQPAEKPKPAAEPAAARAADEAEAEAKARLVHRKLAALKKINELASQLMQLGGRGPDLDFHYTWSKRQMETEREAAAGAKERAAAAEGHLARMRVWEDRYRRLQHAPVGADGRSTQMEKLKAEFYVAEAEQWLAEAQAAEKQPR